MYSFSFRLVFAVTLSFALLSPVTAEPDDASSDEQKQNEPELPYMDTGGARERYRFSDRKVNKYRLYDFYRRQAEYYLNKKDVPNLLPAYPGMDGGDFGHWGHKISHKNNLTSDRWEDMSIGTVVSGIFQAGEDRMVRKGVAVKLGPNGSLAACFDPKRMTYREVWKGGFISHAEYRWGILGGIYRKGTLLQSLGANRGWKLNDVRTSNASSGNVTYDGYYRNGKRAVFSFAIDDVQILDTPWALPHENGSIFTRSIRFENSADQLQLDLFKVGKDLETASNESNVLLLKKGKKGRFYAVRTTGIQEANLSRTSENNVSVSLSGISAGSQLVVYTWNGPVDNVESVQQRIANHNPVNPKTLTEPGPTLWPEELTRSGERRETGDPYEIDRIGVPIENPYNSMMFLSGLDFFENGDAAICTMMGDVWRVSGLDQELNTVTWKRFATGLNQPQGLVMVDNKPAVIGRDQITILHDRDGNGEADLHESFCNKYRTEPGHQFIIGLQRDDQGNFYFATQHMGIVRVSPDGSSVETLASGLRNPNGVGVRSDGLAVSSPQEGTWTPASMIVDARKGFYGFKGKHKDQQVDPPICYVPRGVDSSTGGLYFIENDQFGPLSNQLLALSWNGANFYLVLLDEVKNQVQGAAVPLPGEFRAAAHQPRWNPHDESLYVACSMGWGTYALQDGALHRIRYTGKQPRQPVDFHTYRNGISVTFNRPLAKSAATDPYRMFAQQWSYIYQESYGSKEYSVRQPDKKGHDHLPIRSAHVLDNNRTVFVEIPSIQPVMQMHLHLSLKTADGESFSTDLFPTIHRLDQPFTEFPGYEPIQREKPDKLELRMGW